MISTLPIMTSTCTYHDKYITYNDHVHIMTSTLPIMTSTRTLPIMTSTRTYHDKYITYNDKYMYIS